MTKPNNYAVFIYDIHHMCQKGPEVFKKPFIAEKWVYIVRTALKQSHDYKDYHRFIFVRYRYTIDTFAWTI